jgi:hypothetical protein
MATIEKLTSQAQVQRRKNVFLHRRKCQATSQHSSQIPEPTPILTKSKLKLGKSGSITPESSSDEFECLPFLPKEVRDIIWKLAMPHPKAIAVSVQIKSCNATKGSENHGCDWYKDISFVTSALVDNQFGMAMACKEFRYIGHRALPQSVPTACSQLAGIRYNPDETAIRENFIKHSVLILLTAGVLMTTTGSKSLGSCSKMLRELLQKSTSRVAIPSAT